MEIIGRTKQIEQLNHFYDAMLNGKSQLCFVTGVAGAGKTYMVDHFLNNCVDKESVLIAQGSCNKHAGSAEAYFPFLEILKNISIALQDSDNFSGTNKKNKYQGYAKVFADVLLEQAPELLGTFIPGGSDIIKMIKTVHKATDSQNNIDDVIAKNVGLATTIDTNKIQFQITQILSKLSEKFPLMLCIDDLHWSDDESLNLLYFLAKKLGNSRVFIISTYRQNDLLAFRDEPHPFISMANELRRYFGDIWIDLDGINDHDRRIFVQQLLDAKSNNFTPEFRQAFYNHTNGNPLFAVELLRHFFDTALIYKNSENLWVACEQIEWSKISPKVEGIIEERIGRLDEELREILSLSSVEGSTFSVSVISHILDIPERQLLKLLSSELEKKHYLIEEEETKKIGDLWMTHYKFVNGLFQQHLYNALSVRERMIAHDDIAKALLSIYGEKNEEISVLLAYHFDQGGSAEKALPFYLSAGKRGLLLCSHALAIKLFKRGLDISESLDSDEYRHIELDLMVQYSIALKALKSWDDEEVLEVLLEAIEIAEELGVSAQIGPALFSIWGGFIIKLELKQATDIANRLMHLGNQTNDKTLIMQAHLALSDTLFWAGNFKEGLEHNDCYYELCDKTRQKEMIANYGQDSSVFADMYEMLHCAMIGQFSRAEKRLTKLARVITKEKHIYTKVIGYVSLAWGAYQLEKYTEMTQYATILLELSRENKFVYYQGFGQLFYAVSLAREGRFEESIKMLEVATDNISSGHKVWLYQSLLGCIKSKILYDHGDYDAVISLTSIIGSSSFKKNDICYMPELMRLQAMAYYQQGNQNKSDQVLTSAINMARNSHANVFFLSAAEELVAHSDAGGNKEAESLLEEATARLHCDDNSSEIIDFTFGIS